MYNLFKLNNPKNQAMKKETATVNKV